MARRTKTTDKALAEAVRLIRLGLSKADAAALAGIGKVRFYEVTQQGRDALADGKSCWQAEFVSALEQAESGFKLSASAVIINAANGAPAVYDDQHNLVRAERLPDWKAAAWMLERRFRDEYGTQRNIEISGAGGGPIEVEVATVETLVAKVHALRPVSDPLAIGPGPTTGNGSGHDRKSNGAA